jgi:hypothetical protein
MNSVADSPSRPVYRLDADPEGFSGPTPIDLLRPLLVDGGVTGLAIPAGRRVRVRRALERAEMLFVARVAQDGGIAAWRRSTEVRFLEARRRFTRTGRISRGDTAALAVALVDGVLRDRCWVHVESDRDPTWIAFWLYVARRALPPYRAEPLFLLAWSAWRSGEPPLARRAVDAVLVEEPGHVAAVLLTRLLHSGIQPIVLPSLSDRCAARGGPR